MNLCGTCKFWGTNEDEKETFRECQGIIHDSGEDANVNLDQARKHGWKPETIERIFIFQSNNKAVTQDGSGYMAPLKCREDFGCVLHPDNEEKS
jgi:hypothetical protein